MIIRIKQTKFFTNYFALVFSDWDYLITKIGSCRHFVNISFRKLLRNEYSMPWWDSNPFNISRSELTMTSMFHFRAMSKGPKGLRKYQLMTLNKIHWFSSKYHWNIEGWVTVKIAVWTQCYVQHKLNLKQSALELSMWSILVSKWVFSR